MTENTPARSLPAPLLDAGTRALNAAISADPGAGRALAELAGRRIAVLISDWNLSVEARIGAKRIDLGAPGEAPDAAVSGTFSQLLAAGRSGSPKGLSVTGDAELVHGLSRALSRLPAASWERIARTIGDVPARGIERLAGVLRSAFRDTRERIGETLSEYLQYETRAVASRGEVEDFMRAVDRTRDDVERLAKRLERLERGS